MERDIIKIDEEKCNGCGECIPNCHEGALQIIDGKARLVADLLCDGLGACIGYCPEGAISVERREAEPYDEITVIRDMSAKGANTVMAHLKHLRDHNEYGYLEEGINWLKAHAATLPFDLSEVLAKINIIPKPLVAAQAGKSVGELQPVTMTHDNREKSQRHHLLFQGANGSRCPGTAERVFTPAAAFTPSVAESTSQLTHWPVQMHLVNPLSAAYRNADLLFAADCTAFSLGSFHDTILKGKVLAIACPKLDQGTESYVEKLKVMIDMAGINTITVLMMEVPCCRGLIQIVREAQAAASRKVPVKSIIVSIEGKILQEEWI